MHFAGHLFDTLEFRRAGVICAMRHAFALRGRIFNVRIAWPNFAIRTAIEVGMIREAARYSLGY